MSKYELEIEIDPDDVDKRQKLCSRIDIALACSGIRVLAGEYVVTIERKSAARIRREASEAAADEAKASGAAPSAPASDAEDEACPECGGKAAPGETLVVTHSACFDAMAARRDVS